MKELKSYYKRILPRIYLTELFWYILCVGLLVAGVLYFPQGNKWIICNLMLLYAIAVVDRVLEYVTLYKLYANCIYQSPMWSNVDDYGIKRTILWGLIYTPIVEILKLVMYTLIIPGIMFDILFRTTFQQSVISGNSALVVLISKKQTSAKERFIEYFKASPILSIINILHRISITILVYLLLFNSYEELFTIKMYGIFTVVVGAVLILGLIKVFLKPSMNYVDAIWAMYVADPSIAGSEIVTYTEMQSFDQSTDFGYSENDTEYYEVYDMYGVLYYYYPAYNTYYNTMTDQWESAIQFGNEN